jgi:YhcH/YjgK/YiaL family protein
MIIDTLKNAEKYYCVHRHFKKAFEYIRSTDLSTIEDGKYDIDGDNLRAIISNKKGMTADESAAKFECHDKHIDIQYCITGIEQIGWRSRETCMEQKGEYNTEKDVLFFNDSPDMHFQLRDGQFVIFFPEDVHAPMIGEDSIKKLVIKVKV